MAIDIVTLLLEGDKRTVKNVDQVVAQALADPSLIPVLIKCIDTSHPELSMRAADALQKLHQTDPLLLKPYVTDLMRILQDFPQKEVRWHMAQILPSLDLPGAMLAQACKIWLDDFYHSPSSIVKTFSLQAMHDVARHNPAFVAEYQQMISHALQHGTPAMKARAKNLVALSK